MTAAEFIPWPKIPRLFRPIIITEKIDGTNAAVIVTDEGEVFAQSRKRIITPDADNFGFARWVDENKTALAELGPGHHFGEWWGKGIQRGYGQNEKRFSLFNTERWNLDNTPGCVGVVPELYRAESFHTDLVKAILEDLKLGGSVAAPGFMQPEGVVVFHAAANQAFKVLAENDELPKGQ